MKKDKAVSLLANSPNPVKPKISGFKFPDEIRDKAMYIAWFDRGTYTNFVTDAVVVAIDKWEKKNGVISDEQIMKMKK